MKRLLILLFGAYVLVSCGGNNTGSHVSALGAGKTAKSVALETGADLLQNKSALKKIDVLPERFSFYNGNMNAQMEAHHYVSQLNEDLYQAIMYDGNGEEAKIMGVEYIVSEKLFETLPAEEGRGIERRDQGLRSLGFRV